MNTSNARSLLNAIQRLIDESLQSESEPRRVLTVEDYERLEVSDSVFSEAQNRARARLYNELLFAVNEVDQ